MVKSNFSFYKKLSEEAAKNAFKLTGFFYGDLDIQPEEISENVYDFNAVKSDWSVNQNELVVTASVKFDQQLYGENALTIEANQINLACHIHSSTSNFQEIRDLGEIKAFTEKEISVRFDKAILRGEIILDYFLFLKRANVTFPTQASKVGMKLSENICSLRLIIDGDNSSFPVTTIDDKEKPLFFFEKKWSDINDIFDSTKVLLAMNSAHENFPEMQKNKALQIEFMTQAIQNTVKEVVKSDEDLSEAEIGSIGAFVKNIAEQMDLTSNEFAGFDDFQLSNLVRTYVESVIA